MEKLSLPEVRNVEEVYTDIMSRFQMSIRGDFDKQRAIDIVRKSPQGTRIEFSRPKRTDEQSRLMWASLGELSLQLKWHGQHITAEDWKLIFLDALQRELKQEIRIVPNTDNTGFVNLGRSSSKLSKDEMSLLVELIQAFGIKHGVKFNSEPVPSQGSADGGGASSLPVSIT